MLTDPDLPSGSDRVAAVLAEADPLGEYDAVINLQGDLPTLDPEAVRAAWRTLADPEVDIATLAAPIRVDEERTNPNVVKAVIALPEGAPETAGTGRALYFSRATVPTGEGPLFHHIGLYAYRREALTRFVALPASPLEKREKLEQLRALEAGERMQTYLINQAIPGVNTPDDLQRAIDALTAHQPST